MCCLHHHYSNGCVWWKVPRVRSSVLDLSEWKYRMLGCEMMPIWKICQMLGTEMTHSVLPPSLPLTHISLYTSKYHIYSSNWSDVGRRVTSTSTPWGNIYIHESEVTGGSAVSLSGFAVSALPLRRYVLLNLVSKKNGMLHHDRALAWSTVKWMESRCCRDAWRWKHTYKNPQNVQTG